jgi:cell division protein FtsI/penicillin-binding protein 2
MAALRPSALLTFCCTLFLLHSNLVSPQRSAPSLDLYSQATSAMLDGAFPSPRIEYLLLDLRSRRTVAMRWSHTDAPIPVGSLLKPFVALAYAELHADASPAGLPHESQFPVVFCHGKSDGCWHGAGHGSMTLEQALAESCNAYFLTLARNISAASTHGVEALQHVSAAYDLPAPPAPATPSSLIGLSPEWRIRPLALARAYALLATEKPSNAQVRVQILAGLKLAAERGGTASRVGVPMGGALAKTGTAPCVAALNPAMEHCVANGDGLVVLLAPADAPRLLLLVRKRGTTGAQTADVAGRMLARIQHEEEDVLAR